MVKFRTVISALLIGFLLPIAGFSQQAKEQANQSLAIGSGVTFLGTGDLLASMTFLIPDFQPINGDLDSFVKKKTGGP